MSKCPELGGRAGDGEFLFFLFFFFFSLRGFPTGMFTRSKNCLFHSLKQYAKPFEDKGVGSRSLVREMDVPG